MEGISITEDTLLQAILEASRATVEEDNPHGALTCQELAKRSNHERSWVLRNLHRLIDEGKVEVTELVRLKITNSRARVPAYYAKDGQSLTEALQ